MVVDVGTKAAIIEQLRHAMAQAESGDVYSMTALFEHADGEFTVVALGRCDEAHIMLAETIGDAIFTQLVPGDGSVN